MHHLVFRDELGSMRTLPLEDDRTLTIGRERVRDVVLEDRQVSRHHASIEIVSGSFLLRDAGSANGTFLNGLRLAGASAITLRDGDVIEVGGTKICFATDVGAALVALAPASGQGSEFQETALSQPDLLRDGLAWARERGEGPDETKRSQVLRAFAEGPLTSALRRTLEALVRRVDADLAAAFLRRDAHRPLELVASCPSALDARSLVHDLDTARIAEGAVLFYRQKDDAYIPNLNDTYDGSREHSAAAVPFFSGSSLLGALVVERFAGRRLDCKAAAIAAVYGERIARTLSIRGTSPNDTPVSVLGGVGDVA